MLCEECHENEAEILITEVDPQGALKEKHLCKGCAEKKGYVLSKQKQLSEKFNEFLKEQGEANDGRLACPSCGTTWAQFRKNGKFGCASCYVHFGDRIEKLIGRIQGTTRHTGRRASERTETTTSGGGAFREMEIKRLRRELAKAIQMEEYEKAARIRDDLRKHEERT